MSTLLENFGDRHAASLVAGAQMKCWEEALTLRINLQKTVDTANKLPVGGRLRDISLAHDGGAPHASESDEDDNRDESDDDLPSKSIQKASKSLVGIITSLNNILKESSSEDQSDEEDDQTTSKKKSNTKNKRSRDSDLWEELEGTQKRLRRRWEETVNKWHARMHFGSEQKKSTMRVFNQTIWEQINVTLSDTEKVIEKSRMPMDESPRIGKLDEHDNNTNNNNNNNNINSSSSGSRENGGTSSSHDEEVYDDRTFYSMLLKTYITSSISTADAASMRASDIEAMRMYKKKKQVDRKASKGRKIRYVVHSKLQNFMFPIPTIATGSIDEDRLFASLFQ